MSLPPPEPGLVIRYSYLWHHEHLRKLEEGRKDRPAVIMLVLANHDADSSVTVLPITHSEPAAGTGIEIPTAVKKHLCLDDLRSWVIVSEGNRFVWPGFDLRKSEHSGEIHYGFLPPKFFNQIRDAVVLFNKTAKWQMIPRD